MAENYDIFSRRANFNIALRHFKYTTGLSRPVESGQNIADLLQRSIKSGEIAKSQVTPILGALLVDKFDYAYQSKNSATLIEDPQSIIEVLSKWTALNIIVVYRHPEIGICPINPMKKESWEDALPIKKDELLVVYAQSTRQSMDKTILKKAVSDVHKVFAGIPVEASKEYISTVQSVPPPSPPPASPKPAASKAPKAEGYRITPKYSVLVTNELFHNGNVEAWKRIIASYNTMYENTDVLVYYDGERINDLNALFKWGKVKHGTPILISMGGVEIKDVSKLRRYLFEGASPRFEVFLKGSIDQPLELF